MELVRLYLLPVVVLEKCFKIIEQRDTISKPLPALLREEFGPETTHLSVQPTLRTPANFSYKYSNLFFVVSNGYYYYLFLTFIVPFTIN